MLCTERYPDVSYTAVCQKLDTSYERTLYIISEHYRLAKWPIVYASRRPLHFSTKTQQWEVSISGMKCSGRTLYTRR
jgi:hypothetical protein